MTISLKPKTSHTVKYSIPESIREANPLFVKFFEYYYKWSEQTGQPLDFIQNIPEYNDIDLTTEVFADLIMRSMISIIPPTIAFNKKTLVKNLNAFFKSKGTEYSFMMIMASIFGEVAEVKWMRDYVFRSSGNKISQTCEVAIESQYPFLEVDGCTLIQIAPYARATIEYSIPIVLNGKFINIMNLDATSVTSSFSPNSPIKILNKNIDRLFFEVTDYFSFSGVSDDTLVVNSQTSAHPSIVGLVIRQVGTNAYAEVDYLETIEFANAYFYTIKIKNKSGTWNTNDIYFISESLIDTHYTKNDYFYGTVSSCVTDISLTDPGRYYTVGQPVTFLGGSGANAETVISNVTSGPVESVMILSPGFGYSVGDDLIVQSTDGAGLLAEVETIDGIGAAANFTCELENFEIVGTATGLTVGDELTAIGGSTVNNNMLVLTTSNLSPLNFTISNRGEYSVAPYAWKTDLDLLSPINLLMETGSNLLNEDSTGFVQEYSLNKMNFKYRLKSSVITNPGAYYSSMTATTSGGFGADVDLYMSLADGVITNVPMSVTGSGYTKAYVVIQNSSGTGFVGVCNISGGAVSSISILNGGEGYTISDVVTVLGDGVNATCGTISVDFGVIKNVTVLTGGNSYPYDTTLTYTTTNPGAVSCSLAPVINDGIITSVQVVSGGSGYTTSNNTLTVSNGTQSVLTPEFTNTGLALLVEGGPNDGSFIKTEVGDVLTQDTTTPSSKPIIGIDVISKGSGYYDSTEVTPLSISVTSVAGVGAVFIPTLESGQLVSVKIVRGGTGYVNGDTLTVSGGSGSGSTLFGTVTNGAFTHISVLTKGSGYYYGTTAYIIGDGFGADPVVVVDTGISDFSIINGGSSYKENTTITITDPNVGASGAILIPVVVDGVITDIKIKSPGTNYTNPTLTINGVGYGASVTCRAVRGISKVTFLDNGYGYSSADVLVVGDGSGGKLSAVTDNFGSLKNLSFTAGSGYTSVPNFSAVDNSAYGAVSKVKVVSGGSSWRKPVPMSLPSTISKGGAAFVGTGEKIGAIRNFNFSGFGADYSELPLVRFPISILCSKNDNFIIGEVVRNRDYPYLDPTDIVFGLLCENDDLIVLEDNSIVPFSEYVYMVSEDTTNLLNEDSSLIVMNSVQSLTQERFLDLSVGPEMTISNVDFSTNMMTFNTATDSLILISEGGQTIITENDITVSHEMSDPFNVGDVLVGQKSGATTTIVNSHRAFGQSVGGGEGYRNKQFVNMIGLLNNVNSKLNNNYDIHDFAYKIKSGLSQNVYEYYLKNTVHPAGYSLFGDVEIRSQNSSDVEVVIPDNLVQGLFTIIILLTTLSAQAKGSIQWKSYSWLDENKYKIGAWDYGFVMQENGDSLLLDGADYDQRLLGDGLFTYYPGEQISSFSDLTFENVDPQSPNYDLLGFYSDLSCEIDVL